MFCYLTHILELEGVRKIIFQVTTLCLMSLVIYGFHPIKRWRFRGIPGPRPWWLIGSIPEILSKGQHGAYLDWQKQYGPCFKVFFGAKVAVVVSDPTNFRKMARKSAWRAGLDFLEVGGEHYFNQFSILTSRGDLWRATSNAWHPFFTKESLANFSELMTKSADKLATNLEMVATAGQPVDIHKEFGKLTLDVVGRSAFGVNFHTLEPTTAQMVHNRDLQEAEVSRQISEGARESEAGKDTLSFNVPQTPSKLASLERPRDHLSSSAESLHHGMVCKQEPEAKMYGIKSGIDRRDTQKLIQSIQVIFNAFGLANIWLVALVLFPELGVFIRHAANLLPTPMYKQYLGARSTLRMVAGRLLSEFRQESEAIERKPDVTANGSERKGIDPGSFLALQTRAVDKDTRTQFPDLWVVQQAYTFIAAGYETTANALAFSVYCLAANPTKEAKLLSEIDRFGQGQVITASDLAVFPYAEAVWKEALRLYPPGTLIGREVPQPFTLGGHLLPKGLLLHGNVYGMQRSPAYWKNPDDFVPERFLAGSPEADGNNFDAYMPFGDGARKCIGYSFANQEGILTLIHLYQKLFFRLTPGQVPLKTKTILTQGPEKGVIVTVHRRS